MLALSSSILFVSYGRYVTEKLNKISVNTKMCYKTSHKDSQTGCDRTKDIYIEPDLTRKERVANKQMRDELKERRERAEAI